MIETAQLTSGRVQHLAKIGLTRDEILSGYSITWDDLTNDIQAAFMKNFSYGRLAGLQQMSEAIFQQGLSKTGSKEAVQYLQKFSAEWRDRLAEMPKIDGITIDWV